MSQHRSNSSSESYRKQKKHGGYDSSRDRSNSSESGSRNNKLFVGNLPIETQEDDLRSLFQKVGKIADIQIKSKPHGNVFAFIQYAETQSAEDARQKYDQTDFKGKSLRIQFGKGGKSRTQNDGCFNCRALDHFAKNCPQLRGTRGGQRRFNRGGDSGGRDRRRYSPKSKSFTRSRSKNEKSRKDKNRSYNRSSSKEDRRKRSKSPIQNKRDRSDSHESYKRNRNSRRDSRSSRSDSQPRGRDRKREVERKTSRERTANRDRISRERREDRDRNRDRTSRSPYRDQGRQQDSRGFDVDRRR